MFDLLKWESKFIFAALALGFRFGTWLLGIPFRQKARANSSPPSQLSPAPAPPGSVVVTLPADVLARAVAAAAPKPASHPSPPPADPKPSQILSKPDHGIYLTTDGDWIIRHPREAALLDELDKLLFAAAHRNGEPFVIPPTLDDSQPGDGDIDLSRWEVDDGFDPILPRAMPPGQDGRLWMVRADHGFEPISSE